MSYVAVTTEATAPPAAGSSSTQRRGDIAHLAGGSIGYALGGVLLRSLSILLLPLYTRLLTPADYGVIGVSTAVTAVLGLIFPLGLNGALTAQVFVDADANARRRRIGAVWVGVVLASLAGAVTAELVGPALFDRLLTSVEFSPYGRLAVWTAFFNSVAMLPLTLCQILEKPRLFIIATAIGGLLNGVAVVVCVAALDLGAYGYLLGTLIATAVMAVGGTVFMARQATLRFDATVIRQALAYGLPLVVHGVAGWALSASDRAVLERILTLDDLGMYAVAAQLALVMNVAAQSIGAAWVPFMFRVSGDAAGGDARDRLAPLVTVFAAVVSMLAVGLVVVLPPAMRLAVGADFAGATRVVGWLVAGWWLYALYLVPANFLFLRSKTLWLPLATLAGGLAGVAANVLLVPRFGMLAGGWASIAGNAILLVATTAMASRVYPFPYETRRLAVLIASAALAIGLAIVSGGTIDRELAAAAVLLPAFAFVLLRFVCSFDERALLRSFITRLRPA
jgi:O-antigen/teichoic acid export membrane protein